MPTPNVPAEPATLPPPGPGITASFVTTLPFGYALPEVPGYSIEAELGRGGMGVVYRAVDARLNRVVALKMLLAGPHAAPEELQRFLVEARAVAALQHPGIVQVYEIALADNLPYFTLEFCSRGSLAARLGHRPQLAQWSAELVSRLARSVQAAHEAGVVHRDLKPENVLFDAADTPKISDFGLAKRTGEAGMTGTGQIMGTPSYMAPEQARGDTRRVGPAVDVYALGAILYECLTGRPPFQAANAVDTLLQVVQQEPASVRSLNPAVPRDLETVCAKCLRKEPGQRYASAADLADDLTRFVEGRPVLARPIGPLGRAIRWCRRRPAIAGLLGVLGLAIIAIIAGEAWYGVRLAEERNEVLKEKIRAEQERDRATRGLYAARVALAERLFADGDLSAARGMLESCPVAERGWEYRWLVTLCGQRDRELPGSGPVTDMRFEIGPVFRWTQGDKPMAWDVPHNRPAESGSLRLVKDVDKNLDRLRVLDGEDRVILTRLGPRDSMSAWALSPMGDALAVMMNVKPSPVLLVVGVPSDRERWRHTVGSEDAPFTQLAFSPDGQQLAAVSSGSRGGVFEAKSGKMAENLPPSDGRAVWYPDGSRLLLTGCFFGEKSGKRRSVKVVGLNEEVRTRDLVDPPEDVTAGAWSPDGTRIVLGCASGVVSIWNAETLRLERELQAEGTVEDVAIGADDVMAVYVKGRPLRLWGLRSSADGETLTARGDDLLGFSVDGQSVLLRGDAGLEYCDPQSRRIETMPGEPMLPGVLSGDRERLAWMNGQRRGNANETVITVRATRDNTAAKWTVPGLFQSPALNEDGSRLAAVSRQGVVAVWDVIRRERVHRWEVPGVSAELGPHFWPGGGWAVGISEKGQHKVCVLDAQTGEVTRSLAVDAEPVSVCCDAKGERLAVGLADGVVRVWTFEEGEGLTLRGHTGAVRALALGGEPLRLFTTGDDGTVRVWTVDEGLPLALVRGRGPGLRRLAVSPEGRYLAVGGEGQPLRVWDAGP